MTSALERIAENLMFRLESAAIQKKLPPAKISNFKYHEGILWSTGRFDSLARFKCEDVELDLPFYNNSSIALVVPVVRQESLIFHSYALFIHLKVRPHSGVETTMREIYKKMFIIGNPPRKVARIRKDCAKCRRIHLRTVELNMAAHTVDCSTIAPPLFQMDIAYGFSAVPWKKARNKVPLYALVIVCILSSATSILSLEGLECQDVVAALERHISWHGVPAVLYEDNGTQLVSLEGLKIEHQVLNSAI